MAFLIMLMVVEEVVDLTVIMEEVLLETVVVAMVIKVPKHLVEMD
tara:strand:- start:52 stop:186 length:135 start_codon:yes stop_codon:yes gene_type:complete